MAVDVDVVVPSVDDDVIIPMLDDVRALPLVVVDVDVLFVIVNVSPMSPGSATITSIPCAVTVETPE